MCPHVSHKLLRLSPVRAHQPHSKPINRMKDPQVSWREFQPVKCHPVMATFFGLRQCMLLGCRLSSVSVDLHCTSSTHSSHRLFGLICMGLGRESKQEASLEALLIPKTLCLYTTSSNNPACRYKEWTYYYPQSLLVLCEGYFSKMRTGPKKVKSRNKEKTERRADRYIIGGTAQRLGKFII